MSIETYSLEIEDAATPQAKEERDPRLEGEKTVDRKRYPRSTSQNHKSGGR